MQVMAVRRLGKRTPDGIREWTLNDIVLRGFQEEIVKFGVTVVRLDDATGNTDVTLLSRTNKAKIKWCESSYFFPSQCVHEHLGGSRWYRDLHL